MARRAAASAPQRAEEDNGDVDDEDNDGDTSLSLPDVDLLPSRRKSETKAEAAKRKLGAEVRPTSQHTLSEDLSS